jgi:hypothetical protein
MKGASLGALQSLQINCLSARLAARHSSSHGIDFSVKALPVKGIAPLVRNPTLLLAVSSALWFSAFTDASRFPEGSGYQLFGSSVFLQSLTQLILAQTPQRSSSSHGLLIPYSTSQVQRSFFLQQASTPAAGSTFRVWLPSWRIPL